MKSCLMSIEKFKHIFSGLDRAYGQYFQGDLKNGKQGGNAYIKKDIVTDSLWQNHLEGKEPSFGVIPIRDDSTCSWGCIDIDTYPLEHDKIINKIRKLELPLIVCRSKSGGAHLFLFTEDPVTAEDLRNKLTQLAAVLGYGNCEIFPKQIKINADRGDTGNFLNLPYFNSDESNRHAFLDDGSSASLQEFYDLYDTHKVKAKDINKIKPKLAAAPQEELNDGPPCLQTLMQQGIQEGGRDNTLYQYAVYAKKKWEQGWEDKVSAFNHDHIKPNLEYKQVQKIINQHTKQDYQYKCKDQPMCAFCDSIECRTREFGVGFAYEHKFSNLQKYQSDNSVWFISVDGQVVSLNTRQLYNQSEFILACIDQVNIVLNTLNRQEWMNKIKELIENVEIIEMPDDVRIEGRFDQHLESFILDQGDGANMDELRLGKSFTEEGKTYFLMAKLEEYLEKKRFKGFDATRIGARIRQLNGDESGESNVVRRIRGKSRRVWWIKELEKSTDEFNLPKEKDDEIPF